MTDFRALVTEMAAELDHYQQLLMDDRCQRHPLADRARAALAQPEPQGPTDEELWELYDEMGGVPEDSAWCLNYARAVLARWGNHPGSPDSSDGPAVSDDREPASVIPQLNDQLHRRATILLIRKVIDQAIRDTASVQWRVADTGEQLVRVSDLVAWAEHMEQQMEQLND